MATEWPSVSVLIAAYNAAGFVDRAILSALRQTLPVKEVLVIDDASTDGTAAAVRRLMERYEQVRLIELPTNGGPSAARNAGLDAATGEWLAVLDADDAFLPERMEQMVDFADEVQADIVVDNFRYYNAGKGSVGRCALDDRGPNASVSFSEYLSRARPFRLEADWGLLKPIFRRSFIEKNGLRYPLKTRHGEDFLMMCEAFMAGAHCALYRRAGYLYTSGSANLSRTVRDYHLMYQHTRQLLGDRRIARNPALVRRMRERAAAVKKLAAEFDLARFRHNHDYNSIARHMIIDSAFRTMVVKRMVRHLLPQH